MNYYSTKDYYLSGYLLYKGFLLLDNKREQGFTEFIFEHCPELKEQVSKYYRSQTSVDPCQYGQILRQLKGTMHSSVSTNNQVISNVKQYKEQLQS